MRRLLLALLVSVELSLAAQGVRPPDSLVTDAAKRVQDEAGHKGEELADRSKVFMGTLNVPESRAVRQWDLALQSWKKEKGSGSGALLAEGVLFDCLSRLHGILTSTLRSETAAPYFLDLAAQRPRRASKAFQSALKIDPNLVEARFRDARIRADKDEDARKQLEQIGEQGGQIGYLSTMSRAETARNLGDSAGARRWYERAISLSPNAPAPRVGLAALTPAVAPIPFESLDHTDLYYSYPCVVLTQPIAIELARRIEK